VVADSPDRILHVTRGDFRKDDPTSPDRRRTNYIVALDRNGNEIENWSQWDTMMAAPHAIGISPYDPERHVWVVDNTRHQVWKFTNDGKTLVQTWGVANTIGADQTHFNAVASITFLPDGSFLLGDGYEGIRVVKFDAQGNYVMEFAANGVPFDHVHAVAVDRQGRIIVADRDNSRIQVFTPNGEFIEEWPNIRRPNALHVDAEGDIWVVDGRAGMGRLLKYNEQGVLQDYWGTGGPACSTPSSTCAPGAMSNPHGISVDGEGNLYIPDYNNNRTLKFVPRPGADPARMVGQPLLLDE
jgi:sugar lactone lactonase YvrE